jgi:hypothetical protein
MTSTYLSCSIMTSVYLCCSSMTSVYLCCSSMMSVYLSQNTCPTSLYLHLSCMSWSLTWSASAQIRVPTYLYLLSALTVLDLNPASQAHLICIKSALSWTSYRDGLYY